MIMTKRPLRHAMAKTTTTTSSDVPTILSRVGESFRRSLHRRSGRSARKLGSWRDSRRKPVFVSPDLRRKETPKKNKRDEVSSFSSLTSSSSSPSTFDDGGDGASWKKIVVICFLFLLHNLGLILTIINFKATSPPSKPVLDSNRDTGKLFLYGFDAVSNETKTRLTPAPLCNNIWIGLGILQNIWIGYSIAGIFRRKEKRRFVEQIGIPSDVLLSCYLHATTANLLFFFLFDRKYLVAALGAIFVAAIYAVRSAIAIIRDFHRMEDALSFSYSADSKFVPLLVFPLAAWGAWVVVGAVHVGAIVAVNVLHCDDAAVSIVAACIIAAGDLTFMVVDVTKFDLFTRRILGPYVVTAIFLIGGVFNHASMKEASKFVLIGCAIVAILLVAVRCALSCYRNKRRRRAKIRMIHELVSHS